MAQGHPSQGTLDTNWTTETVRHLLMFKAVSIRNIGGPMVLPVLCRDDVVHKSWDDRSKLSGWGVKWDEKNFSNRR